MSNPLDELLKKYEDQLVLIQKQKEEAKNAFDTSTDTSGVQGAGGIVATVNNSSYIALSAEL